ncbi:hypothetical protein Aperf_G00000046189 [Anoplocephala perfoliata]
MPRRIISSNFHNENANQSSSSAQPLLSNIPEFNSSSANEEAEITSFRTELSYFLLSSIQRWKLTGDASISILVQLIRILVVTAQLLLLGSLSSTHVNYSERAQLTFRHLYLYKWDPQYETLPYPPSVGEYAIYSREDFYESLGFAMRQYNITETISLNGYKFPSEGGLVTACAEQFGEIPRFGNHSASPESLSFCVTLNMSEVSTGDIDTWEHTASFLNSHGLDIDFSRFHSFSLNFSLMSPPTHHSDWDLSIECFQFFIFIDFENVGQTGQVAIRLNAEPIDVPCPSLGKNKHEEELTPRRVVHLMADTFAFSVCLISLMMSLVSLCRGFGMWKRTKQFFNEHYGINLKGLPFEFMSPWIFCVIAGDFLIIGGSICKLVHNKHILDAYAELSYMLGLGTLLVWISVLRYVELSSQTHLLLRTIKRCVPGLIRFLACALVLYFAFVFPAWVIMGPFSFKFRSFTSTLECLYSLINGDDMFVTFSIIEWDKGIGIFLFSRIFLYVFITLFIYAVLNIFVTIVFEAYEEVKEGGFPQAEGMVILNRFLAQQGHNDEFYSEMPTRPSFRRLSSGSSSVATATTATAESPMEAENVNTNAVMHPESAGTGTHEGRVL